MGRRHSLLKCTPTSSTAKSGRPAGGMEGVDARYVAGAAAVAFVSEVMYGLTSFGPAIVFHLGFHALALAGLADGTVRQVVFSGMALPMLAVAVVQSALLGSGCHWRLLVGLGTFGALGTLLGTAALLAVGTSVWLKRSVGVLLLGVWTHRQREVCRRGRVLGESPAPHGAAPDPTRSTRAFCAALACGGAAGLLSGLTGVGGPPLMVFVAAHRRELHMHTWRATCAVLRLVLTGTRVAMMVCLGSDGFLAPGEAVQAGALCAASLSGLVLGNALATQLDERMFHTFILWFLLAGSLLLATAGFDGVEELAQGAVIMAGVAYFCPCAQRLSLCGASQPSAKLLAMSDVAAEMDRAEEVDNTRGVPNESVCVPVAGRLVNSE
jgi:uncharacterized membrane protein YfcA